MWVCRVEISAKSRASPAGTKWITNCYLREWEQGFNIGEYRQSADTGFTGLQGEPSED